MQLELLPGAIDLWEHVKDYDVSFLTSVKPEKFREQKRCWVQEHFGDVQVDYVYTSKLKANWATPTSVLIDDRMKSIEPWIEAGGIGILHTSAEDTIAQLLEFGI